MQAALTLHPCVHVGGVNDAAKSTLHTMFAMAGPCSVTLVVDDDGEPTGEASVTYESAAAAAAAIECTMALRSTTACSSSASKNAAQGSLTKRGRGRHNMTLHEKTQIRASGAQRAPSRKRRVRRRARERQGATARRRRRARIRRRGRREAQGGGSEGATELLERAEQKAGAGRRRARRQRPWPRRLRSSDDDDDDEPAPAPAPRSAASAASRGAAAADFQFLCGERREAPAPAAAELPGAAGPDGATRRRRRGDRPRRRLSFGVTFNLASNVRYA